MPLGDRQPLHSGELMTAGGVGDLQGADILLVAADHLPVGILNGRHIVLREGSFDESLNNGRFADASGAEHRDAVVGRHRIADPAARARGIGRVLNAECRLFSNLGN